MIERRLPNGKIGKFLTPEDIKAMSRRWRKPWWHGWVKAALVIGLIWLCWPAIRAGLMCLYAMVLLAILGLILKPINALGRADPMGLKSKRRQDSCRW